MSKFSSNPWHRPDDESYCHSRMVDRFLRELRRTSGDFIRKEIPKPVQRAMAPPNAAKSGYVDGSLSQAFLKVRSLPNVRKVVEMPALLVVVVVPLWKRRGATAAELCCTPISSEKGRRV